MLKRILFAGAASILISGAAQAADIVEPAVFDWTGPYVGLQGGYAWGDNDVEVDAPPVLPGAAAQAIVLNPPEDGSIDIQGWVGGLHLGYLWQSDSLVLGIEGDGEFADIDGDTDVFANAGDPLPTGELEQEIDWLASLRLRAGFAWDRTLLYATGGLAVGGVELTAKDNGPNPDVDESDTEWGWTVGGGLEFAFTDALSARIEYRYTDLGKTDLTVEDVDFEVDNTFHAVRLGVSWHFFENAI
jgi:outer membrane immunogenic protein